MPWYIGAVEIGNQTYAYYFRSHGEAEAFEEEVRRVADQEGAAEALRWLDDIAARYGGWAR